MMLECSFCHKKQDEVRKLISGDVACICDYCLWVCAKALIVPELPDILKRITALEDKYDTDDRNTQES